MLPDIIKAYAELLQLCSITKNLRKLRILHALTIKSLIDEDKFIQAKLISGYVSCSEMNDAQFIFSNAEDRSDFMYNTIITGYASVKKFNLSLAYFRQMIIYREEITRYTLPAVLKSVAGLSHLRVGKRVHGYAVVRGFTSDLAQSTALIRMYGKCGDLVYARKVFDEMPERNLISWCAIMGAYEMHGDFDMVFSLFDWLIGMGGQPDAIAFITVLTACNHGGRIDKGMEYFQMMTERFGIRPSKYHYSSMVLMLARAGRIAEAKEFFEMMEIEPEEALWRTLLRVCKFYGVPEITVRGRTYVLR